MNFIEIFKKIILSPKYIFEKIKEIPTKYIISIYFLYAIIESIIKTIMPADFIEEMSRKSAMISEHSFLYYLSISILTNFLYLIFFSSFFVGLSNFLKSKIKILIVLLSNFSVFIIYYTILKRYLYINIFLMVLIIFLVIYIFIQNREKYKDIFKLLIILYLINIILSPVIFLTIKLSLKNLYIFTELIITIWFIILFTTFSRKIFSSTILYIFFSFFFSYFNSFFTFYILKYSGFLTNEIFKIIVFT